VPLLYHELWEGIKGDSKVSSSNDLLNTDGNIEIEITEYRAQTTLSADGNGSPTATTLISGSYSFEIDLLFNRTFPKLGLCDVVLINIGLEHNRRNFFAVVVHVVDHWPIQMENSIDRNLKDYSDSKQIIRVSSQVVLYVSKQCSDAAQKHCESLKPQKISLVKLSNITSSRRQISAIYNISSLADDKRKSLLQPSDTDVYFHHEHLPIDQAVASENFNIDQMRVINYAERIFNDEAVDRLHLVHGPPGLVLFF
jgi:hypothetical protein